MSFCFCGFDAHVHSLQIEVLALSYASAMVLTLSAVILAVRMNSSLIEGVIITDSVEARKGLPTPMHQHSCKLYTTGLNLN